MVVLASFTQPTDGIRHRQNNTTVYVNDNNIGKGTLYIAESRLSWVSDSGSGFSIEYPHISLHAVSRDLSAFPQECLFLMLDTALGDENEKNGGGDDGDENENENDSDEQETTELRLVPDDRGMLDAMFHAMNACQALHPDPEDSFSDEDFYEDADDEIPMEEADSRMANLSIENMENRGYILNRTAGMGAGLGLGAGLGALGRVAGRVVDMEEGMGEDMGEDMGVVNISGRGTLGAADEVEDRGVDMEEDMVAAGSISGRGILGVGAEGMEVGREEGTVAGRAVGMGAYRLDRAVGLGVDRAAGMVVDRAAGMVVGRAVGPGVSMGAERAVGMGEVCSGIGMAQGDRPFSSGNIWHQGRTARFPQANPSQTGPEEDSHFADAEN